MKKDFSDFDFDEAFYRFYFFLNHKLVEHGFCNEDEFIERYIDMAEQTGDDEGASFFTIKTYYWHIDKYEVLTAIAAMVYKKAIDAFSHLESFQILDELRDKLDNRSNLEENELILLFDECIHAQHETGSICDVDIERLKQELDKKYENVKVEKMFEPVNA
jgi:hypothetical protein